MSSSKRGLGWGIAVGLLGTACVRINPAYDLADGGEPTAGSASVGTVGDGTVTSIGPGDGTVTSMAPGDGTVSSGSVDGGSVDGGSEGSTRCESDEECADDEYCNGTEICDPSHPEADGFGCLPPSEPRCPAGATCLEEAQDCMTDCDMGDADEDGLVAVECGGPDCDDLEPSITLPGNDWAHCQACGVGCDPLQACLGGACVEARRVFVTSSRQSGDMGGVEGADDICQDLADAEGLGGSFRAYIRNSDVTLEERLEHAAVPYVRLDGVLIANEWTDLTDGNLQAPLARDEHRAPHVDLTERAWTGLQTSKVQFEGYCGGWMDGLALGAVGEVPATGPLWEANNIQNPCTFELRLYCIEQDGG